MGKSYKANSKYDKYKKIDSKKNQKRHRQIEIDEKIDWRKDLNDSKEQI